MENEKLENAFPYDTDTARLPFSSSYIRLLELHPPSVENTTTTTYDAPLIGTIKVVPIASPPPYTALSYTWGTPNFTEPITINTHPFLVTESLSSALRHLRLPTTPLLLWIDQISINQRDDVEKSAQVGMMNLIYAAAAQVLVWLGPAQDDSDVVMDVFAEVGQAAFEIGFFEYFTPAAFPTLQGIRARKDESDKRWLDLKGVLQKAYEGLVKCLVALEEWDKRPWMKRVWIIQELCLAADVQFVCGNRRVSVDYIRFARVLMMWTTETLSELPQELRGLWYTVTLNDPTPSLFSARVQWKKFERGAGPGDTLLELLRKTYVERGAEATDPRDRVFGLLGLARDAKEIGVVADYTKPVLRALTDVARRVIEAGDLGILSYVQFYKLQSALPSWVPDWHPNMRPSFYPYPRPGKDHVFSPPGASTPIILPCTDPDMLGLKGFLVDTVEDVGSVVTTEGRDAVRFEPWLSQVRFLCKLSAAKDEPIYSSSQRRAEAIWRISIADIYEVNHEPTRGGPETAKAFEDMSTTMKWFETIRTMKSTEETERSRDAWPSIAGPTLYKLSMEKMTGMRLYITKKGYVGMGPSMTGVGDSVVVFLGARVCSILRPEGKSDDKDTYFYLGEAYCDGVMDGELVGQRNEEEFYLV